MNGHKKNKEIMAIAIFNSYILEIVSALEWKIQFSSTSRMVKCVQPNHVVQANDPINMLKHCQMGHTLQRTRQEG